MLVDISHINVRRTLTSIRQKWDQHHPTTPFYLTEELEPGINVMDFCVAFLMIQRLRRKTQVSSSAEGRSEEETMVQ